MVSLESKNYQLRVRITNEERDFLEKQRVERSQGETISDLVREAIALLVNSPSNGNEPSSPLNPETQAKVERLAVLLKREPQQVVEACVEGILDLIESKCEVPLIVMETHLHLKYQGRDEKQEFPWNTANEIDSKAAPAEEQATGT